MIQLVNKQIHKVISGEKSHEQKKKENKTYVLSEKNPPISYCLGKRKINSFRGLRKRRKCSIQVRANV